MDTDEVGIDCTQGGCAADAPVTIRGEGGDAASGGCSRLQSEVALWWAQKRARRGQLQSKVGQELPETNRGVRRCTFLGSDGRRCRLASETGSGRRISLGGLVAVDSEDRAGEGTTWIRMWGMVGIKDGPRGQPTHYDGLCATLMIAQYMLSIDSSYIWQCYLSPR
jgi:hypothetical protein